MPDEYAAKPRIEIDGNALPPEIELRLERVIVEDDMLLPDMAVLRFRDPDRDVLEKAGLEIGKTLRVLAAPQGQEASESLITAEVTALEAEFDSSGSHTIVRAYDPSHRLHHGRRTETYRNVTDSDVVRTVGQRAGLELGQIDETPTVYRHISQANASDWEFLSGRARESGQELAVADGKLEFRAPADAGEAPEAGDLTAEDPLQLVLGADLEMFRPRVTSAEQVSDVSVRGWDPERKQAVVGTAQAVTVSASLPVKPADLASVFGDATYVVVDRPLSTQNEVDAAAKAVAEQVASAFAGAEGIAKGNPKLRSGTAVSVGLTGAPFEGMYTITAARHVFDNDGYRTHFVVSGRHGRSLLALAAFGGANGTASGRPATIPGVVTAQVTSVGDSGGQPRVKLSFPWLSETYESDWVRTLQAGAGDGRGFLVLPEVNDEVLVAFEHGDVRRPYVLGGLYNGVDLPKLADQFVDKQTGEVQLRGFMSRKGHLLEFLDGDREDGITLSTVDEGLQISLDNANTTIKVTSKGDISIEGSGDVSIRGNRMKLEADAGVTIDAGGGNVTIKGTQIQLN